jgi:non-ribosomal peptide synthetase component E (peptide arylation enzyme)
VSVYAFEPAADSQWVVVEGKNDQTSRLRFFARSGATFREDDSRRLPEIVGKQLQQRIPRAKPTRQRLRRSKSVKANGKLPQTISAR